MACDWLVVHRLACVPAVTLSYAAVDFDGFATMRYAVPALSMVRGSNRRVAATAM